MSIQVPELIPFENLQMQKEFENDNNVCVFDFKYGQDNEASKFNAFPVIKIITENGTLN